MTEYYGPTYAEVGCASCGSRRKAEFRASEMCRDCYSDAMPWMLDEEDGWDNLGAAIRAADESLNRRTYVVDQRPGETMDEATARLKDEMAGAPEGSLGYVDRPEWRMERDA